MAVIQLGLPVRRKDSSKSRLFVAARALVTCSTYENRETGPASWGPWPISAPSLYWGSRPWNLKTEFWSVMTAALSLYSPPASNSSFTTNSSRTILSTASNARRSAPVAGGSVQRRARRARSAVKKPRFRSSRPRVDQYCAVLASRGNRRRLLPLRHLRRPVYLRVERQAVTEFWNCETALPVCQTRPLGKRKRNLLLACQSHRCDSSKARN